ncbi:MAG: hypothetical protein JJ913_14670 [Rhizobiaceae bacterium]|nr:hypothetical protein [Rhizobiaceae bacterium]
MPQSDIDQVSRRICTASTILRVSAATVRLRIAAKYNPYWHLQPRVPAGYLTGGQWLAGVLGAAVSVLPAIINAGRAVVQRLLTLGRSTAPRLRGVPRKWDREQPGEDTYDAETRRVSPHSKQRPGLPIIRFRNERELRRYLGPAGSGREWHHIVEKRLAGRNDFPAELIHSTDNIISLPMEVHRHINAKMSSNMKIRGNVVLRHYLQGRTFAEQYDYGLDLITEALEEFGYDPADF